jgi:hypothetical protein
MSQDLLFYGMRAHPNFVFVFCSRLSLMKKAQVLEESEELSLPPKKRIKIYSGKVQDEEKPKKKDSLKGSHKKLNQSAWMITIVFNKPFQDSTKEYLQYEEALKAAIANMLEDDQKVLSVLRMNKGVKNRKYEDIRAEFVTERSDKMKYLHAHGVLLFIHRVWMRLVYKRFQDVITECFKEECVKRDLQAPLKKLYVHIDFNNNWASKTWEKAKVRSYIFKTRHFFEDLSTKSAFENKHQEIMENMDDEEVMVDANSDVDEPATKTDTKQRTSSPNEVPKLNLKLPNVEHCRVSL